MADTKITALTADTSPTSDDLVPTVTDPAGTPANRKVTATNLITKAHGLSDGIVKVATGTMAVATSGTDYAPATSGSSILKGNGSGGFSAASAGTDYYNPGGTDVAVTDGGTGASTATAGFNALAPTTTQGDMIYHNGTNNVRLPKGTASQVLTMNAGATAPEWAAASGGGGGSSSVRMRVDLNAGFTRSDGTPGASQVVYAASGTSALVGVNNPKGVSLSTGTTNTGIAYIYYHMGSTANGITNNIWDKNPRFFAHYSELGDNSDHKTFLGIGADWSTPSDSGASRKLIGFRILRSSSTTVVYAVNGNASSETATDVTSSLDGFSAADNNKPTLFWIDMTSGTSIKFYHNFTLVATHTTNLPSGALTSVSYGPGVFNYNNSAGTVSNTAYIKQAYADFVLV
jgi:hypothetical protein